MVSSVFVTGGSGFLGTRVVARLAREKNRRIVCLIRGKAPETASANVQYVRGDLLDAAGYANHLRGCEAVLHMAAATGKCRASEYFRINRDATEDLVLAARESGVKRFLFVSTIAAKFSDQYRYYYAESKQGAEAVVAQSGLRWTTVRPAIILGDHAPVLRSLERLASMPVVPVFGDGHVPVQPVFVEDLADCLVALLDDVKIRESEIVEIGGPDVISIEELILRIRLAAGKTSAPVLHLPARAVARCLGWLEPLFLPLLPFSAGQLASFLNAGTAAPHPWVTERQNRMSGISEMLGSATNGYASA